MHREETSHCHHYRRRGTHARQRRAGIRIRALQPTRTDGLDRGCRSCRLGRGTPDSNPYDYDLLVQALTATRLVPVLADTGRQFTVFAPNDLAFDRLVTDLTGVAPTSEAAALTTITNALTIDQIKNLLLYHVVAHQKLGPISVLTAGSLTMANGGTMQPRGFTLRDQNLAFRDPRLVRSGLDIQAANGVIHTIDRVLLPAVV